MENTIASFEEELITEWLKNMENQEWKYKEPILDSETVNIIKNACTLLQQDIHVFINSIELLEEYIKRKNKVGNKIEDPMLAVSAVISVSSKYTGEQDLKLNNIQELLLKLTGKKYNLRQLLLSEIDILKTTDNKLALESVVNDLCTLVTKFEHEKNIQASIIPLCTSVLEMMYIFRKDWFFELKELYSINNDTLYIFEKLICSRFFLPSAIIVFSLKHSAYKDSLNISILTEEFAELCKVHIDHLRMLVSKIKQVFQKIN